MGQFGRCDELWPKFTVSPPTIDRRIRGDLIQTYKIVNQIDDTPVDTFFKMTADSHNHATRNAATPREEVSFSWDNPIVEGTKNIVKLKPRTDIRKNFFSHRVVDKWNALPNIIKNARDVNHFKNQYDAWIK